MSDTPAVLTNDVHKLTQTVGDIAEAVAELKEGQEALRAEFVAFRAEIEVAHATLLTEITRRVEAGQTAILSAIGALGQR